MQILSHRGYWKEPAEKNLAAAFDRSFSLGFGTETDIRDFAGSLVVSHDPPEGGELPISDLLEVRARHSKPNSKLPLALNIKSDGLQQLLAGAIASAGLRPDDYFVFDMSIPDALGYLRAGLTTFTRQSEYEPTPSFYDQAAGVWMDCFKGDWVQENDIRVHLEAGKKVCLVSPDLHKRPYREEWKRLSDMRVVNDDGLMLCTDFPEEAKSLFCG